MRAFWNLSLRTKAHQLYCHLFRCLQPFRLTLRPLPFRPTAPRADVVYDVADFPDKNKDTLNQDVVAVLVTSGTNSRIDAMGGLFSIYCCGEHI